MPNSGSAGDDGGQIPGLGDFSSPRIQGLFNYWIKLRGGRDYPSWSDVNLMDVYNLAPHLAVFDVEPAAEPATHRFRYRFCGTALVEARGALVPADPTGAFLDEIEWHFDPEPLLVACAEVARRGMPALLRVGDVEEDRFHRFERAFFPLGPRGGEVEQLIACIDRVYPDGY